MFYYVLELCKLWTIYNQLEVDFYMFLNAYRTFVKMLKKGIKELFWQSLKS